jgi:hypothetical protein
MLFRPGVSGRRERRGEILLGLDPPTEGLVRKPYLRLRARRLPYRERAREHSEGVRVSARTTQLDPRLDKPLFVRRSGARGRDGDELR